jgi:hypothetical protein
MNPDEVLKLFRSRAQALEKTYTRSQDVILLLAEVVAHCSDQLSQEDVDSLLHIGGVLVKRVDTQSRARLEVAATLKDLHDSKSSSSI